MKATRKQLAEVIADQMDSVPSKKLASHIAAYVVANHLTKDLDSLLRDVVAIRTRKSGLTEVTATSAFPLSEQTKREIKQLVNADKMIINEVLDSTMVGGVRVESNGTLLDLTVRNRLNILKKA